MVTGKMKEIRLATVKSLLTESDEFLKSFIILSNISFQA